MQRTLRRRVETIAVAGLLLSILAIHAVGQMEDPTTQQGLKPYSSYHGGDFDAVSLVNGKVDLHIPLVSWPQRGNLKLGFTIRYDNPRLTEDRDIPGTCGTPGNPCTYTSSFDGGGVQVVPDLSYGIYQQAVIAPNNVLVGYIYSVQDPSGATHPLGNIGGSSYESTDATGYSWNSSTNVITDRNGTRYYNTSSFIIAPGYIPPPVSKVEDTNGNQITYNAGVFTDALGRTISFNKPSTTDFTGCTGQIPTNSAALWTVPGPNGASVNYKFCYAKLTLNVLLETGQYHYADTSTPTMLQSIVLPNGSAWTFDYDSGSGALIRVTMPTGGTISYGSALRHTCGLYGSTIWPHNYEYATTSRSVDPQDGSGAGTWRYVPDVNNGIINKTTDPLGNDTVHTISALGTSCSLYETETQYYQGSASGGVLLKTVDTAYSWTQSTYLYNGIYAVINVVPIRLTTTLPNGSGSRVQKTEKDYDSGFTFTDVAGTQWTGTYGDVIAERSYDYGAGAPGPLLQRTTRAYMAVSNANYRSYNLLDALSSVSIYDNTANTCKGISTYCSYSYYGYDETLPSSSGVATQHNASPVNGSIRGNLTSVHRWLNTSNTYLSEIRAYFDTGEVSAVTDPGGHTTTYLYSSAFAGSYVTETDLPNTSSPTLTQHKTFRNYDYNTGLPVSSTDQNNNMTGYTYDSMRRISLITPPSAGGATTFAYSDTPGSLKVEKQTEIDTSGRYTDELVMFDGLGRETSSLVANDESVPWDRTDTCYDARGTNSFTSYPYQTSVIGTSRICSGPGDMYSYDALSRKVSVTHSDGSSITYSYSGTASEVLDEGNGTVQTQRVAQVDGLGRLVSVCEVTGGTLVGITGTPAACGQDIAATGFLTSYQYDPLGNLQSVSQGGLNPRSFAYDSLSRLVSNANPEAGTTSYGYDPDGNPIQRVRPTPNQTGSATTTTTFQYDQLHRLTGKTYSDATPAVSVNYDEATAFGNTALANTIGRKSSEFTGATSSKLSGAVYSYDNMGRIVNNSQCTPQNCSSGNFSISYSYDLSGDLITATNGVGITLGYGYNRAGRLTLISSSLVDANHPPTLLGPVQYNAFGLPALISIGDTNSEALGYTPRGWLTSVQAGIPSSTSGTFATGWVTLTGPGERSYQDPGAQATGSVTISGTERSKTQCIVSHGTRLCDTYYDSGTVTVTVNGHLDKATYGQGDTYSSIASRLAAAINGDSNSTVTATPSGGTVSLRTKLSTGAWIPYSATVANDDPVMFPTPSFSASPLPSANSGFTGGRNPGPVIYDTGTVTITVNGAPVTVSYGQGSTTSSIAQAFAAALNSSSAFVTAAPSGATVNLTSRHVGVASDYPISSTSATSKPGTFSGPSFTTTQSGGNLINGSGGTTVSPSVYSLGVNYAPDGNVTSVNDSVNGSWAYSYDPMNRLITSGKSGQAFSYLYDRFGNRWQQNVTAGSGPGPQYSFDANNRMFGSSVTYDAAGNIINDGSHTYTYDAENRISSVDGGATATYVYDAGGERIRKTTAAGTVDYLYDLGGNVTSEISAGAWTRGEVYAAGRHLAIYSGGAAGPTYFSYVDWLGTERTRTTTNGSVVETCQNLAYGDSQVCTGSDPSPLHFTGKMRDTETGLDEFPARYYSSAQGRWYSPDWASAQVPIPYADLYNPQTLNLYSYVGGDPTNHPDADGHVQAPGQEANNACQGNQQCAENKQGQDQTVRAQNANTMPLPAPIVLPLLDKVVDVVVGGLERVGAAVLSGAGAAVTVGVGYVVSPGTGNVCTCSTDQPMPHGPPASTSQQGAVNTDPINSSRSTLPRGPGGEYLPHPDAQGAAHTNLGTRVGHDGKTYTQGSTFDSSGRFVGRTDVTNHGRGDHSNPHFHPAKGPASVGPAEDVP